VGADAGSFAGVVCSDVVCTRHVGAVAGAGHVGRHTGADAGGLASARCFAGAPSVVVSSVINLVVVFATVTTSIAIGIGAIISLTASVYPVVIIILIINGIIMIHVLISINLSKSYGFSELFSRGDHLRCFLKKINCIPTISSYMLIPG
jgi:hypothetical protein